MFFIILSLNPRTNQFSGFFCYKLHWGRLTLIANTCLERIEYFEQGKRDKNHGITSMLSIQALNSVSHKSLFVTLW